MPRCCTTKCSHGHIATQVCITSHQITPCSMKSSLSMQNWILPLTVTYSGSGCPSHSLTDVNKILESWNRVYSAYTCFTPFHGYLLVCFGMYLCIINHPVEISALLKPQRLPWTIFVFVSGLDSAWLICGMEVIWEWNTTTYSVLTVDHTHEGPGYCEHIDCRCSMLLR